MREQKIHGHTYVYTDIHGPNDMLPYQMRSIDKLST